MTIRCQYCGQPAIGPLPEIKTLVRAIVICPECLEKVPNKIANNFLEALDKIAEEKKG